MMESARSDQFSGFQAASETDCVALPKSLRSLATGVVRCSARQPMYTGYRHVSSRSRSKKPVSAFTHHSLPSKSATVKLSATRLSVSAIGSSASLSSTCWYSDRTTASSSTRRPRLIFPVMCWPSRVALMDILLCLQRSSTCSTAPFSYAARQDSSRLRCLLAQSAKTAGSSLFSRTMTS